MERRSVRLHIPAHMCLCLLPEGRMMAGERWREGRVAGRRKRLGMRQAEAEKPLSSNSIPSMSLSWPSLRLCLRTVCHA